MCKNINLNVQIVLGNTKPSQSNDAEMQSLTEFEKESLLISKLQLAESRKQTIIGIATLLATVAFGLFALL